MCRAMADKWEVYRMFPGLVSVSYKEGPDQKRHPSRDAIWTTKLLQHFVCVFYEEMFDYFL